MRHPEFVTYAGTKEAVFVALEAGADHLILEDPSLSARSYVDACEGDAFDALKQLVALALQKKPRVRLSFNLDILVYENQFPLIDSLLVVLDQLSVSRIRVQDLGLAVYLRDRFPRLTLDYAPEMGNHSPESVKGFRDFFQRQVLSNELPVKNLKQMVSLAGEAEIQVHGPILIQYSRRRFQQIEHGEEERPLVHMVQDELYPNRDYPVLDNTHGHFMYLYFDRCLLAYLPLMVDLGLSGWLFDGRGESFAYLTTAMQVYRQALNHYLQSPDNWQPNPEEMSLLASVARRPLKPGFFLVNRTDAVLKTKTQRLNQKQRSFVGTVVSIEKGRRMVLALEQKIHLQDSVVMVTPDGREMPFQVAELMSLGNQPISQASEGDLVQVPWQKGAIAQSMILQ